MQLPVYSSLCGDHVLSVLLKAEEKDRAKRKELKYGSRQDHMWEEHWTLL